MLGTPRKTDCASRWLRWAVPAPAPIYWIGLTRCAASAWHAGRSRRFFQASPIAAGNTARGFTLIELMIALAVTAVLALIAIPTYDRYITQSRRAAAQADMLALQLSLERYRANNSCYGAANTDIPLPQNDHYDFFIVNNDSAGTPCAACASTSGPNRCVNAYIIEAVPRGTQATRDPNCGFLRINQNGVKCAFPAGTAPADRACPAVAPAVNDANRCWRS